MDVTISEDLMKENVSRRLEECFGARGTVSENQCSSIRHGKPDVMLTVRLVCFSLVVFDFLYYRNNAFR